MLETSHAGTNRIGFEGTLSATRPMRAAPLFHPTGVIKAYCAGNRQFHGRRQTRPALTFLAGHVPRQHKACQAPHADVSPMKTGRLTNVCKYGQRSTAAWLYDRPTYRQRGIPCCHVWVLERVMLHDNPPTPTGKRPNLAMHPTRRPLETKLAHALEQRQAGTAIPRPHLD